MRYEYRLLVPPTLLIVGAQDRTVPLGTYATPAVRATMGNFVELGRAAVRDIPHARLVVIPDAGHIPHLERPEPLSRALVPFLSS